MNGVDHTNIVPSSGIDPLELIPTEPISKPPGRIKRRKTDNQILDISLPEESSKRPKKSCFAESNIIKPKAISESNIPGSTPIPTGPFVMPEISAQPSSSTLNLSNATIQFQNEFSHYASLTEEFSQIETAVEDLFTDAIVTDMESPQNPSGPSSSTTTGKKSSSSRSRKDPKRIEQNREAQRNFRERRKLYIKELEDKLVRLESIASESEDVQANLKRAEERIAQLLTEKESWKQERQIWVTERHEIMKMLVHLSAQFSPMMSFNPMLMNPMMGMFPPLASSFSIDSASSICRKELPPVPEGHNVSSSSLIESLFSSSEENSRMSEPIPASNPPLPSSIDTTSLDIDIFSPKSSTSLFPPRLQSLVARGKDKCDQIPTTSTDTLPSLSSLFSEDYSKSDNSHESNPSSNALFASTQAEADCNPFQFLTPVAEPAMPIMTNPLAAYASMLSAPVGGGMVDGMDANGVGMSGLRLSPEDIMLCMHQYEQQRSTLSLAMSSSVTSAFHPSQSTNDKIEVGTVDKSSSSM